MRPLLYVLSFLAVLGLGFWAYRENYATQAQLKHVAALQDEIATLRESIALQRAGVAALRLRLHRGLQRGLDARLARLKQAGGALNALSPLATLGRGYSILREGDGGPVVRRADQVRTGDTLEARLAEGRLRLRVEPDPD